VVHGKKSALPKKHLVDPEFHQILPQIPENILLKEENEKIQNIIGYEPSKNKFLLEGVQKLQFKGI
jgi:hypothetical protein